jgi:catechol 2,3-dioxygenase-like lactoylglutathione lyase family enzyme
MLANQPIMGFVPTTDPAKARAFYEEKLGLKFLEEDPFALSFDVNGILLRISTVRELKPAPYTIFGWNVADIYPIIDGLAAKGVVFEVFDGLGQDEKGVWTAPGGTRIAWFKDPDGNVLSLAEHR